MYVSFTADIKNRFNRPGNGVVRGLYRREQRRLYRTVREYVILATQRKLLRRGRHDGDGLSNSN